MKTTIELPDELLAEAKAVAARRRITLKSLVEHALTREIRVMNRAPGGDTCFTVDDDGLPVLKKDGDTPVTSEQVYTMMENLGI